jgi:hypothetical protein
LSFTCLANTAYVLYFLNNDKPIPSGDLVVLLVTMINLIVFLNVLILMWRELKGESQLSNGSIKPQKNRQEEA